MPCIADHQSKAAVTHLGGCCLLVDPVRLPQLLHSGLPCTSVHRLLLRVLKSACDEEWGTCQSGARHAARPCCIDGLRVVRGPRCRAWPNALRLLGCVRTGRGAGCVAGRRATCSDEKRAGTRATRGADRQACRGAGRKMDNGAGMAAGRAGKRIRGRGLHQARSRHRRGVRRR